MAVSNISISATIKNSYPSINWTVTNNNDVVEYLVERSYNAKDFETIASILNENKNNYSYDDKAALNGTIFYRIKAIEKDGNQKMSSITSVVLQNSDLAQVAPNPTQGITTIISNDFNSCAVLDIYGKTVLQSNSKILDLSTLVAGQYLILVKGKHSVCTLKITKH